MINKICKHCNKQIINTRERTKFCNWECFSNYQIGRPRTKEVIEKIKQAHKNGVKFHHGWKHTKETKEKQSFSHQREKNPMFGMSGDKNPNWQGGITPINTTIRNSLAYKDWRTAVFIRDNYTCQECGSRGYNLHADHIKPFAYFPELRLVIENGRTLCVPCHKKTDTYGAKVKKLYKEIKTI